MSHFTLAATGDSLLRRSCAVMKDDSRFMAVIDTIRSADAAYTNLESHFNSWSERNYPIDTPGSYGAASPAIVEQYKWCGFNIVSRANNHVMDFGHNQILEESATLDQARIVHAGAGRNLAEAAAPAYLETAHGRVALISFSSTFVPGTPAGKQRKDAQGRPGLNPLRVDEKYVLPREHFDQIKEVHSRLGFLRGVGDGQLTFLGKKFVLGDKHAIIKTVNKQDAERILGAIKEARRAADYVMVSFHHHNEGVYIENPELFGVPEDFVQEFSRACIDNGCDVVIGHGPHVLQGIEVYHGKPILYSLSNFFYETDLVEKFPQEIYDKLDLGPQATPQDVIDARKSMRTGEGNVRSGDWYMKWYEAVVAVCTWEGAKVVELKLYPTNSYHESRAQAGRPRLADDRCARSIIEYLGSARYSGRWGTRIRFDNGVGYVVL